MSVPFPTSSAAARFAQIIEALCRTVPTLIARDNSFGPLIILICNRLRLMGRRFAAIAARAEAGMLAAPRRGVAERAAGRAVATRRRGLLPCGYAWLVRLHLPTAGAGSHLQHLVLNDPEMVALLAASPQAGRIVRAIFWMVAVRPVPKAAQLAASSPRIRLARAVPVPPDASPLVRRSLSHRPSAKWPRECNARPVQARAKLRVGTGPAWPD